MHGERDTAPRLDASIVLASCLQLGSCCTRVCKPQQMGRAFLSPPLLIAAGDLEIWAGPWGRACIFAPFCSAPSLAETNKRCSKYVLPFPCPGGMQQIPAWLGPAACPSFTPFERGHVQMWQQAGASCRISPNTIPPREELGFFSLTCGSIFHLYHPRGCLAGRSSHFTAASMATHGLSKREQVHGQIFPLCSRFLGSCSSKPSLVSWLAFPQRRIISPSSPGQ